MGRKEIKDFQQEKEVQQNEKQVADWLRGIIHNTHVPTDDDDANSFFVVRGEKIFRVTVDFVQDVEEEDENISLQQVTAAAKKLTVQTGKTLQQIRITAKDDDSYKLKYLLLLNQYASDYVAVDITDCIQTDEQKRMLQYLAGRANEDIDVTIRATIDIDTQSNGSKRFEIVGVSVQLGNKTSINVFNAFNKNDYDNDNVSKNWQALWSALSADLMDQI